MNADAIITRALADAIEYCRMMFDLEMSVHLVGATPTAGALAWRRRATEYQKLRKALMPRAKKASEGKHGTERSSSAG